MARADTGAEEERPYARAPLLTPGEHVAGLEVGAVIGRGRLSTVHRAREAATGRETALKVLSAAPGAEASVRFVREFELARTLAHPHIVPVYEHGSLPSAHDRAGAPWTGYATLVFLAAVLVLMALDRPIGTWTVATLVVIVPALIGGWYLVRDRVLAVARERVGFTGDYPVVANPPAGGSTASRRREDT